MVIMKMDDRNINMCQLFIILDVTKFRVSVKPFFCGCQGARWGGGEMKPNGCAVRDTLNQPSSGYKNRDGEN